MRELTLAEAGFDAAAIVPCKPREFFTIEDKYGVCGGLLTSRDHAEARRAVYDFDYSRLGPHRVVRLMEMPA